MITRETFKVCGKNGWEAQWTVDLNDIYTFSKDGDEPRSFGRSLQMGDENGNSLYVGDYVEYTTTENEKIVGRLGFIDHKWLGIYPLKLGLDSIITYLNPSVKNSQLRRITEI